MGMPMALVPLLLFVPLVPLLLFTHEALIPVSRRQAPYVVAALILLVWLIVLTQPYIVFKREKHKKFYKNFSQLLLHRNPEVRKFWVTTLIPGYLTCSALIWVTHSFLWFLFSISFCTIFLLITVIFKK